MDRVTLKLKYDGVIRRVSLKKSPVSMEEVRGVVASMYNLSSYELSYTDDEGDRILVDCDSELLEALEVSRQSGSVSLIRLDLTEIKKPESKEEEIAPKIPCEKEEKGKEEKEEKKSDVPLCYVCKIQAVQLTCHTCDFLLCDTCHFENILFRSHHNPSHIFHTYRKKVDGANVEVRVEIIEEVKQEGLIVEEKAEEEEGEEEVKEEVNEVEQAEEAKDEPLLGFPNPVGSLLKLLLGDPEKKEEAQEEVQEEVKGEVKEEVGEEVKEEVQEEEKIPEARAAALESLLPMGFDPERVNTVLDFVQNNVEAALEILVGDAQ